MWHHHGSDTPTSPKAILLHSSLLGAIELWITLYTVSIIQGDFEPWPNKFEQVTDAKFLLQYPDPHLARGAPHIHLYSDTISPDPFCRILFLLLPDPTSCKIQIRIRCPKKKGGSAFIPIRNSDWPITLRYKYTIYNIKEKVVSSCYVNAAFYKTSSGIGKVVSVSIAYNGNRYVQ